MLSLNLAAATCQAQDPTKAYPKNYILAFENERLAVIRVHYGPHETVGVHDHSDHPTIYVYLNDGGPVRFTHSEDKPFALTRSPTSKGAFRVSPGRIERHTVENLSDAASDFLRVELKRVPLGSFKDAFRGDAPGLPLHATSTVEFRNRAVSVERIICPSGSSCTERAGCGSLYVAFTPTDLREGSTVLPLGSGDIRWTAPDASLEVRSTSDAPAHVLRITPEC